MALSDLSSLFTPYYLGHTLVIAAYIPLRQYILLETENAYDMYGLFSGTMTTNWLTQEQELLSVAAFTLFLKSRKVSTIQQFFEKASLFGKLFVLAVLVRMFLWRYVVLYALATLGVFVFLGSPRYTGESEMTDITLNEFEKIKSPINDEDKKVYYYVLFHADWCSKCTTLEPLFAKLSIQFSSHVVKWAKVDVEQYPTLAAEFSISTNEWQNNQLPTLLCFHKGREVKRLPRFTSDGKVIESNFGEQEVIKYFNLNRSSSDDERKKS